MIHNQASVSWTALRARAIPALREIPGAVALHEFGAAASGRVDAWSDIDMQLQVTSMHDAVEGRAEALRAIGSVWLEWTIVDSPDSWAATVLFEDMDPLCHLDLGFVGEGSDEKAEFFDGVILHWRQADTVRGSNLTPGWYAPQSGTVEHLMLGELLGLVRYAKARHREQPLLCWKFFSAVANRVLEAEYLSHVDPDRGFRKPLSSREYAQLRERMPTSEIDALAELLLCGNADAMDTAVVTLGKRLVNGAGATPGMYRNRCEALLNWLSLELGVENS